MRNIGLREIFLSSGTIKLKTLKFGDYILGSLAARLIAAQAPTQIPFKISRILVIRPGGIGDAVFLLPIFKAIKIKYPPINIDVLCQRRNEAVFFSQRSLVDHVFVFDSLIDLRNLYKGHYDIVIDTEQWHYLSALSALYIKAPVKIGFSNRPLRRKFFNINVNYDNDAYELDNFSTLFAGLLASREKIKNIDNCYTLPQDLISWAKLQIPPNSVAVSIGASVPERCLSTEQVIILVQGILRRGFHPVLLGGKDGLAQSRDIMEKLDNLTRLCEEGEARRSNLLTPVSNFVGKISLQESVALIKTSRMFVGTDSGLMHLACAVGSPVIAFFGAGNMAKWMQERPGQISINEHVTCSPCTAFGYGLPSCHGSYICLRKMDLEAVLDKHCNDAVL